MSIIRLNKVIREFNVGIGTIVDFLHGKGFEVNASPSEKITEEQYEILKQEFGADKDLRKKAEKLIFSHQGKEKKAPAAPKAQEPEIIKAEVPNDIRPRLKTVGQIDIEPKTEPEKTKSETKAKPQKPQEKPVEAQTAKPEAKAEAEKPAEKPEKVNAAPQNTEPRKTEAKAEEQKSVAEKHEPKEPLQKAEPATQKPAETKTEPVKAETKEAVHNEEPAAHDEKATGNKEEALTKKADTIGTVKDGIFQLHPQVEISKPKVLGTIDLSSINQSMRPKKKTKEEKRKEREEKNKQGTTTAQNGQRKKRNRIGKERIDVNAVGQQVNGNGGARAQENRNQPRPNTGDQKRVKGKVRKLQPLKPDVSDEDVAKQVKETLARLTSKGKGSKGAKYRREKRETARMNAEEAASEMASQSKVLKLTEFVTANELASMMNVPVNQIIATCMSIGIMVSINQRMDAETIDIVAEEFGYKTEYVSAEVSGAVAEEEDNEEDLVPRAPIVTVMGHVDHGKTSLLDYIRKSNVIAGEAGGITQHIGAYNVTLENGRHITFLDTPGHEAFTAMRARGAQVTDVAIIIIAADDDIMPQTKEAISHAVAANVPIVFAINKIDKDGANPDKIKEGLANMNFLIEEWGGKYQSQDISAKKGVGVKDLLEKVLLEADMLDLKANPNRKATGTVIESSLDRGRGYVGTILVSNGTLRVGDIVLAGTSYGRVKALFNERDQRIESVGPAEAATMLGLNGAPQAGDVFHVMDTEQEVREIATKREQLQREQALRAHSVLSLDEIGRRIARGGTKELNLIVKGDVDGSVEALSDSLEKLSTEKIKVNVILKSVGQISENDVALAAASQAIIIGFQVRPSVLAKKQADQQGVDIRLYSIIYDTISEVKAAMEGMLEPVVKEEVTATIDVRQVFHISKVGFVAGAFVTEGKVTRSDKARLIRDGIVIQTANIAALKRFKDDVREVAANFECGISLQNCNDIQEGDIIETFKEVEVKAEL